MFSRVGKMSTILNVLCWRLDGYSSSCEFVYEKPACLVMHFYSSKGEVMSIEVQQLAFYPKRGELHISVENKRKTILNANIHLRFLAPGFFGERNYSFPNTTTVNDSSLLSLYFPSITMPKNLLILCKFSNARVIGIEGVDISKGGLTVETKQDIECETVASELAELNGVSTVETKHDVDCQTVSYELSDSTGFQSLSNNLKNLLLSEEESDIKIKVGSSTYSAHKAILGARSSVFKAMLTQDMMEKNKGVVDIPDSNPGVFRGFLIYLYAGKVNKISIENACELYHLSDKYNVEELRVECVKFIRRNLNIDNIVDVISMALKHGERDMLVSATDFFTDNVDDIFPSVKWQEFIQENPIAANEFIMKAFEKIKANKQ